jgi:hypothetical protein
MGRGGPGGVSERRRNNPVRICRIACWSGFTGAVLLQAAILIGIYQLTADGLALTVADFVPSMLCAAVGCALVALARLVDRRMQPSLDETQRAGVRLVVDGGREVEGARRRPAA